GEGKSLQRLSPLTQFHLDASGALRASIYQDLLTLELGAIGGELPQLVSLNSREPSVLPKCPGNPRFGFVVTVEILEPHFVMCGAVRIEGQGEATVWKMDQIRLSV